ncbi:hypothetical protein JW960_04565 [candidate division KSB1 bacterium]|nr:hypothetical protein [candidate division KSB1 bacterium]
MNIQFLNPLSRAWDRMVIALFKPFDLMKWFVVGFTAFLADLTGGSYGGGGGSSWKKSYHDSFDFDALFDTPREAWFWLQDHMQWIILFVFGAMAIVALIIVLTWVSSRGSFMFLDNVVQNRSEISRPWRQFKRLADSLFLWKIIFGFVSIALVCGAIALILVQVFRMHEAGGFDQYFLFPLVSYGLLLLLVTLVIAYISTLLHNFVVPIMYKHDITVLPAWRTFMELFLSYPLQFILYGLLLFVIHFVIIFGVIIVGLFTCCCGFALLALPYISSVVLLPISYTLRAFGVEFLEQFGPEYEIFPKPATTV